MCNIKSVRNNQTPNVNRNNDGVEEYVALEKKIGEDAYRLLEKWKDCCNKDTLVVHPEDRERWEEFVVAAFKSGHGDRMTQSEFCEWMKQNSE